MGPRPNGRGKSDMRRHATWDSGFNGAAAKRPRKVIVILVVVAAIALQWGRGQTAAESSEPYLLMAPHTWASMGPRPNGRGKLRTLADGSVDLALQWGRGQTAAESTLLRRRIAPRYSFNGAAAKRPRKAYLPPAS